MPFTKLATLLGASVLLGSFAAAGQTAPIAHVRDVSVAKASAMDTRSMQPQIDTTIHQHVRAPENEDSPRVRPLPSNNNLPVGRSDPSIAGGTAKLAFQSIGATGWTPPDCDMGVSDNWVVTSVNMAIAFHKKATGEKVFQQEYSAFFAGTNTYGIVGDPKTFFDPLSKRWFTIIMEVGFAESVSAMLLAVSDDENPNGVWNRYRIEDTLTIGTDKFWLDYPGVGVNKDTLVFTGNMFGFANGYAGNLFAVLPKAPLLTGAAVVAKQFNDQSAATTKVGVNADASSDKVYCVSFDNSNQLKLTAIENGATNPVLTSTFVTIPNAIYPGNAIDGPSGHNPDRFGDARLYSAHYRGGSLVTAHSVQVSNSDSRHMVRWYQIGMNNWPSGTQKPTLTNVGNIVGSAGEHLHMPAINQNSRGDIALVYTKTSASIQADIMLSGHKKADAYGVTGKATLVASSGGLYGGAGENRWGDYFSVAVDPVDNRTFWAYSMTGRADGRWSTYVSNYKVSAAGDNAVAYNADTATPLTGQGTLGAGNKANLAVLDAKTMDVNSVAIKNVGQVASLETTYQTGVTSLTTDYAAIQLKIAAPAGTTGFVYLWNYVTSAYDLVSSAPVGTSTLKYAFSDDAATKYISREGKMKSLARTVRPIKGAMPPSYALKVDQYQALAGQKTF